MTIFQKSNEPTEKQPDASEGIVTSHIDVINPGDPWIGRIQIHGGSVQHADELRDQILEALQLVTLLKKLFAS